MSKAAVVKKTAPALATESTDLVKSSLLGQLTAARKALGLSQTELADRVGMSRMTVQRAEAPDADPQLSSFLALALALNLLPQLRATDDEMGPPAAQDLVHRGLHHSRTRHDLQYRDREREAAFAGAWETVNQHDPVGLNSVMPPLLTHLIPGCTQDQASATATVIQWLGTEVGFEFLGQALKSAGYALTDERPVGYKALAAGETPVRVITVDDINEMQLFPEGCKLKLPRHWEFLAETSDDRVLYFRVAGRKSGGRMSCEVVNGNWSLVFDENGVAYREGDKEPFAKVALLLPADISPNVDMDNWEQVLEVSKKMLKKLRKAAKRKAA